MFILGLSHDNKDPTSIDLAALSMLSLVFEKKSFSAAAESLGASQSTVSYTVEKLRKTFNDPLFVRKGEKIVPTLRCEVPRFGKVHLISQ